MQDVAIVGAGDLGGALASILARRDLARVVRLVDASGQIAAGKALDIMQSAPIEVFATRVAGSTDISTVAGAAVVVIADAAAPASGDSSAEDWLLLKQLSQLARHSVVICAGASHRDLVDRAVRELGFPASQILGSAPEALAGALRAVVALETDGASADVALTVLGVPPGHTVIPWDDVTIGGFSAAHVLDEPARRRIAAKVAPLWPPGPYALAAAAAAVIAAVGGQSRRALSCFVAPEPSGGRRTRAAALPVRVGLRGVTKVERPALSVRAQSALDTAMKI